MRKQNSNESRIFVNANSCRDSLLDQQFEFENPQNNFQKLMSLPPDIPVRECKNLLQTMTEHCSFEKNIIKKTQNIEIPSFIKTQIKRKEVFNQYQAIRKYTSFMKKKQHFQNRRFSSMDKHRNSEMLRQSQSKKQPSNKKRIKTQSSQESRKKNPKEVMRYILSNAKPRSLHEIVQTKKNSMLMEGNILKVSQDKITNILNDNHKREKIFQEALFLERFYDIEIIKLKNAGVNENGNNIPEKFRGIEPKHIRISTQSCENEQQYVRKKYVCKKRKLQFYGYARKIEENSLKHKKVQNLGVIQTIMKFNEAKCATEGSKIYITNEKSININEQDLKIKKLFLKYSCSQPDNPEEIYKYIEHKQLMHFFKDFGLENKLQTNNELKNLIEKKKQRKKLNDNNSSMLQNSDKIKYYLFDFIEILYILAAQQGGSVKISSNLSLFLENNIWSKEDKVIPQLWLQLRKVKKNPKVEKFLKIAKFEDKLHELFKNKSKKNQQSQFCIPLINFDDVLEMAWEVKLFPIKVSKKALRFIYLYCISNENGLTYEDFRDLIFVTGLKFGPYDDQEHKIKWVANQIIKNTKS